MILYVVQRAHMYPMLPFLQRYAEAMRPLLRMVTYETLLTLKALPRATYVFTDLDRLSDADLATVSDLAAKVERHLGSANVHNDPRTMLSRYPLIEALHARGNPFRAYMASEIDQVEALRFPVFLRLDRSHQGALTGLLHDRDQLSRAILEAGDPDTLRVVEFYETADPATGVYTKYSAHLIGDRIVPDHVIFSHKWMLRRSDLVAAEQLAAEQYYREQNPHAEALREIFAIAKIRYGRVDYSFCPVTGAMVVWEINTNPDLSPSPQPERLVLYENTSVDMIAAFRALAESCVLPD
jgi:hypothetical protein